METDETLKQQFKILQDQQQQKLLRRKQMKEEKENLSNNSTGRSKSFGIDDNLDLKVEKNQKSYLSEELVEHLNNEIRELRDENGRCYKLLSEREFEIKQLKKKKNEEQNAFSGIQVTNETAATKIVELSKKIREMTAELESEKTKNKQINKKCHDLQMQLTTIPDMGSTASQRSVYYTDNEKEQTEVDIKALQDRLRQAESKVGEFRNQSSQLKQELKVAHKVLSQEVGENVNIQSLLSGNSNWRGRAQQVILLQKKVEELKSQIEHSLSKSHNRDENDLENELMGRVVSSRKRNQDEKYKEELKKYEKEKKEAHEKTVNELKALENDHAAIKTKLEASKARNKILTNEVKSHKQQMSTLVEKGRNDDELIQALMKQQTQLKEMLDDSNSYQRHNNLNQADRLKELSLKSQQDTNIVEQLKSIVAEKEVKVHQLEEEINQMKIQYLQKIQGNIQIPERPLIGPMVSRPTSSTNEMLVKSITPPASRHGERPPSGGRVDSARTHSRSSLVRPSSVSNNITNQKVSELEYQCQEYRILLQTTQVEKEKLSELVQILQKRIEESVIKSTDSQSELLSQRRTNALLEKQLAKLKVDQTKSSKGNLTLKPDPLSEDDDADDASSRKRGVGNHGSARLSSDITHNEDDLSEYKTVDELQTCLEIQKDENEALKSALHSTLQAKDEDLRVYSSTMDETKKVFIQALRQYKQAVTQQGT